MTTTQTRELLAAVFACKLRYDRAMADGELGWFETLKFLREAPGIRLAIENVHLVPVEVMDLQESELPEIAADISNILRAWGVSHRMRDISGDIISGLHRMIPTAQRLVAEWSDMMATINARPPTALPA